MIELTVTTIKDNEIQTFHRVKTVHTDSNDLVRIYYHDEYEHERIYYHDINISDYDSIVLKYEHI